jgi:very-short-patch-repair endonuclease
MPRIPLPDSLRDQPFTSRQGLEAGLGRKRIAGRDIQNPFYGTHTTAVPSLYELCRTFATRMPSDAFFSGVTAAALRGVPLPRGYEAWLPLHVGVPHPRRAVSGRGVKGHSVNVDASELELFGGLRVSRPARLWCELSASLTIVQLVAAGDFIIHWRHPLATLDQLTGAADCFAGRVGGPRRRAAVCLLDGRAESPAESRLRVVLVRGGIQDLRANLEITTTGGYRYRADLAIVRYKIIIEYQSDLHLTRESYGRDRTRISRLVADGWLVIEVTSLDLSDEGELVARVKRHIASRA